jgi:CRP-like cAMP-binding protein
MLKILNVDDLISLIENVNTAWSVFCRHWIRMSGLSIRGRLQSTLQDLAARFGARESRGILMTITVSHDELAAMIASSRPRVTRLIAELVREKLIARQGRHYILLNSIVQNGVRETE